MVSQKRKEKLICEQLCLVVHSCNLNTEEAGTGELTVEVQPELFSRTLFQKQFMYDRSMNN